MILHVKIKEKELKTEEILDRKLIKVQTSVYSIFNYKANSAQQRLTKNCKW